MFPKVGLVAVQLFLSTAQFLRDDLREGRMKLQEGPKPTARDHEKGGIFAARMVVG